jgi:hypothetical protein
MWLVIHSLFAALDGTRRTGGCRLNAVLEALTKRLFFLSANHMDFILLFGIYICQAWRVQVRFEASVRSCAHMIGMPALLVVATTPALLALNPLLPPNLIWLA